MSKKIIIMFTAVFILGGCVHLSKNNVRTFAERASIVDSSQTKNMEKLTLKSRVFVYNGSIPSEYTCDGEDINPPLEIENIPKGTQSLVLIVDDPDAPGGNWDHWLVWNISPDINQIEKNSVPTGAVEGTTDFNRTGWGGPCPPSGTHRYFFKLYALDTVLDIDTSTRKPGLEQEIVGHILEEAVLIGKYMRTSS
jgi:Raf kinase inhibitor-like YbhB/YbcL family protein